MEVLSKGVTSKPHHVRITPEEFGDRFFIQLAAQNMDLLMQLDGESGPKALAALTLKAYTAYVIWCDDIAPGAVDAVEATRKREREAVARKAAEIAEREAVRAAREKASRPVEDANVFGSPVKAS